MSNATVKWDDSRLRAKIARARHEAASVVAARLRRVRDEVLEEARADWPVDSGDSRDSLQPTEDVSPRRVRVGISSDVDYVSDIKGDPWTRLVVEPLTDATADAHRALAADLADLIRRS